MEEKGKLIQFEDGKERVRARRAELLRWEEKYRRVVEHPVIIYKPGMLESRVFAWLVAAYLFGAISGAILAW